MGGYTSALTEDAADDALAVLDAVGCSQAVIVTEYAGTSLALHLAALHPQRVKGLVLHSPVVASTPPPSFPEGLPRGFTRAVRDVTLERWGEGMYAEACPSLAHDPVFLRWVAGMERRSMSRTVMARQWSGMDYDYRPLVPTISCPALVIVPEPNTVAPQRVVLWTAENLGGPVRVVHAATQDVEIFGHQPEAVLDAVEAFIDEVSGAPDREGDATFAVLLFTDLVGSTDRAAREGDRRWAEILEQHDDVTARVVASSGGAVVNRAGDGLLAVFDAPARAIRAARAITAELHQLGLHVRAGVHAGEISRRGDDVSGLAVHLAARVQSIAGADEVLVTRTVRDLLLGSELLFDERGAHELRGIPGSWELFAVTD